MRFVVPDIRPTIRPGTHRAILSAIEARENERGSFLVWTFEVRTKNGTATLKGTSSTKFGTGSKARSWTEALLNRQLAPGETVESDDLLGLPCLVVVRERTLSDGSTMASVEQVLPIGEEE